MSVWRIAVARTSRSMSLTDDDIDGDVTDRCVQPGTGAAKSDSELLQRQAAITDEFDEPGYVPQCPSVQCADDGCHSIVPWDLTIDIITSDG